MFAQIDKTSHLSYVLHALKIIRSYICLAAYNIFKVHIMPLLRTEEKMQVLPSAWKIKDSLLEHVKVNCVYRFLIIKGPCSPMWLEHVAAWSEDVLN